MRSCSSVPETAADVELQHLHSRNKMNFLQEVLSVVNRVQVAFEGLTKVLSQELSELQEAFVILQKKYCDFEIHERSSIIGRREEEVSRKRKRRSRVYYNSNKKRVKEEKRYCNWCGRCGHLEEECWKKKGLCTLCGRGNHFMKTCYKYRPKPFRQHCLFNGSTSETSISQVRVGIENQRHMPQSSVEDIQLSGRASYSKDFTQLKSPEDSFCFTNRERTLDYVLNDSVVFPSRLQIKEANYYQLCPMEGKVEQSMGVIMEQGNERPSSASVADDGGIVLTAQDETWDVSSIENPDLIEETPASDNFSEGIHIADVAEESLVFSRKAVTSKHHQAAKMRVGSGSCGTSCTSWSCCCKKQQIYIKHYVDCSMEEAKNDLQTFDLASQPAQSPRHRVNLLKF